LVIPTETPFARDFVNVIKNLETFVAAIKTQGHSHVGLFDASEQVKRTLQPISKLMRQRDFFFLCSQKGNFGQTQELWLVLGPQ
jgi:hypothetical protein